MSHRLSLRTLPFLIFTALFVLTTTGALGQEKKLKELQWSHAFDLACRKNDEKDITKSTKRWGVEAFRDNNTGGGGTGLYISETGCFALAPHFSNLEVPLKPSKGPAWLTGLDMPTRKAGVTKWEKTTKIHSMEVFRDPNADNWLFITDAGNVAACNGKLFPGAAGKSPKWLHSVDLQVRKGGVKEFKDAAKFGVEIYRDGNTGNLIYVSENGFTAILPEEKEVVIEKDKIKSPEWLHGLDLQCRKSDEKSFTKDTRIFGVEVYNDLTTGNLLFISETGCIAVVPAAANQAAPTTKAKQPAYSHGLNIKCRKYGEVEFSATTKAFGAEVFRDENLGMTIYINETGSISVIPTK